MKIPLNKLKIVSQNLGDTGVPVQIFVSLPKLDKPDSSIASGAVTLKIGMFNETIAYEEDLDTDSTFFDPNDVLNIDNVFEEFLKACITQAKDTQITEPQED